MVEGGECGNHLARSADDVIETHAYRRTDSVHRSSETFLRFMVDSGDTPGCMLSPVPRQTLYAPAMTELIANETLLDFDDVQALAGI